MSKTEHPDVVYLDGKYRDGDHQQWYFVGSIGDIPYDRRKTCVWRVQDDLPGSPFADKWQTGCGYEDNAHPDDRDFVYCPYCGSKIKCLDIPDGSDEL